MIHIVTAENIQFYLAEMEQVYRLRHDVFVGEKKWGALAKPDGREVDQFDNNHALHMLYIEDGEVLGYQRMLPTTSPHLLSEVYPQLCEGELPRGANIWEWTRYCVKASNRERGRALSPIGNALLSGIIEWGLENGVDRIIIEMSPLWMVRLLQLRFKPDPLGFAQLIENEDTVAVIAKFNLSTLHKLQQMRGNSETVLAQPARPQYKIAS